MIFQSSSDSIAITGYLPEVKIDVLNYSLFMGIMSWFESDRNVDGLEEYLKNIVSVCMNGINNIN
jgi:hypothetical protein